LNAEGVPTLSGKGRWQKGTIGDLLAQVEAPSRWPIRPCDAGCGIACAPPSMRSMSAASVSTIRGCARRRMRGCGCTSMIGTASSSWQSPPCVRGTWHPRSQSCRPVSPIGRMAPSAGYQRGGMVCLDHALDTYHCPTHGVRSRRRGEVRQAEIDEVCLYVCTRCGEVADPLSWRG
jgi:hypothetical protein